MPVSTIMLVIYFFLVAIGHFGLWAAPAWLLGLVAFGVMLALLFEHRSVFVDRRG